MHYQLNIEQFEQISDQTAEYKGKSYTLDEVHYLLSEDGKYYFKLMPGMLFIAAILFFVWHFVRIYSTA